ncbi:acetylornithine aminotransferase [Alkalihalobacillus xiaoxiensis]|uniref:Acetylornithine aminotransferase n=1 Tax=Shouchella xiaoxiensis TaxID=766895 RepID=A0ABS2SPN2_9BACI|nr:aminotransferase class III-fold pyridoxal phosphate-dependent enzyme [Shouchella xiaoxiensis]MBM7837486.1 acetylornithine aminotransferase [Shouchella xiaoxiensis]
MNWLERDQRAIMSTYGRLPIVIKEGKGSYLIDEDNREYLDLITGLAVNVVGHSHPDIVSTLTEQGQKFLHISNLYVNKPAVELAEKISAYTTKGKVFFVNSGAEATEATIKLIHKWSKAHGNKKKGIVVLKQSFHGRTLGAIKLTRQKGVYQDFPLHNLPVYEVEAENISELKQIVETFEPAALLMEPVLGSGGVVPLSQAFIEQAADLCRANNMLFCMDEIQTGMGRTGKWFAYMHTTVDPDIVLFAKGVGGGLPLGGLVVKPELNNLFSPGDHGTTFAPSPLSSALGLTVFSILEKGVLEQSNQVAAFLHSSLQALQEGYPDLLDGFRGKGMMIGLPTKLNGAETKTIQAKMIERGILVDVTQQTIIRLLPPLTLSLQEAEQFVHTFHAVLAEMRQELDNV